jgi:hypothetical protein
LSRPFPTRKCGLREFANSIWRFLELSNVSETHQLCTSEMLIDETAC